MILQSPCRARLGADLRTGPTCGSGGAGFAESEIARRAAVLSDHHHQCADRPDEVLSRQRQ